jgi:hypothetical protein
MDGQGKPALVELYPDEKGPFHIFDWKRKNLTFAEKGGAFAGKSGFTTYRRYYWQGAVQTYDIVGFLTIS